MKYSYVRGVWAPLSTKKLTNITCSDKRNRVVTANEWSCTNVQQQQPRQHLLSSKGISTTTTAIHLSLFMLYGDEDDEKKMLARTTDDAVAHSAFALMFTYKSSCNFNYL